MTTERNIGHAYLLLVVAAGTGLFVVATFGHLTYLIGSATLAAGLCWRLRGKPWPPGLHGMVLNLLLTFPVAAMSAVVAALLLWSLLPHAPASTDAIFAIIILLTLVAALVFSVVVWLGWHHRRRSVLIVALLAVPTFEWVIADEDLDPGLVETETSLSASASHGDNLLREYWSVDERQPLHPAPTPLPAHAGPEETGIWRLYLVTHRTEIEQAWTEAEGVRQWMQRLEACDTLGDSSGERRRGERNTLFRDVAQLYAARAGISSLDGNVPEAAAVLGTLLTVARKVEAGARTRDRYLPAMVAQTHTHAALRYLLHTETVDQRTAELLARVLAPGESPVEAPRRILLSEVRRGMDQVAQRYALRAGGKFLVSWEFNPHATANLFARYYARLAAIAKDGRAEGIRTHQAVIQHELSTPAFKNPLGRSNVAHALETAGQFALDGWRMADERRALLAEVQAKLATTPSPDSPSAKGTP